VSARIGLANLPDPDTIQDLMFRCESPGLKISEHRFWRNYPDSESVCQNVVHAETDECQVFVVQDAGAVSALAFRNALIELGPRSVSHGDAVSALAFRNTLVELGSRGLCNGPGLASGTEYSRRRSSTLDPGAPDKRDVDFFLILSRAEYAQRRSFDLGISDAVWNIQEPSTLGGDLSIPISRMRFGISKRRVRSAKIFRSRYLGCGLEYPRAEYARRRSFNPGISDADFEESSTLDGDRVLSVPRSLVVC